MLTIVDQLIQQGLFFDAGGIQLGYGVLGVDILQGHQRCSKNRFADVELKATFGTALEILLGWWLIKLLSQKLWINVTKPLSFELQQKQARGAGGTGSIMLNIASNVLGSFGAEQNVPLLQPIRLTFTG
ncbi:hypothetical protein C7R88_14095 [Plesiomonas shigelloides]|uniref:hypothetical protein n=1 Tax=Plesiomonas shigelloides TaxID=703 RepID=UPI000D136DF7|nr:hypothetical protein [Plesiomonas shigelloides]AVQ88298.1 hypothetical protein C7R88_14095 [Plesiomonas shigelloides]